MLHHQSIDPGGMRLGDARRQMAPQMGPRMLDVTSQERESNMQSRAGTTMKVNKGAEQGKTQREGNNLVIKKGLKERRPTDGNIKMERVRRGIKRKATKSKAFGTEAFRQQEGLQRGRQAGGMRLPDCNLSSIGLKAKFLKPVTPAQKGRSSLGRSCTQNCIISELIKEPRGRTGVSGLKACQGLGER